MKLSEALAGSDLQEDTQHSNTIVFIFVIYCPKFEMYYIRICTMLLPYQSATCNILEEICIPTHLGLLANAGVMAVRP